MWFKLFRCPLRNEDFGYFESTLWLSYLLLCSFFSFILFSLVLVVFRLSCHFHCPFSYTDIHDNPFDHFHSLSFSFNSSIYLHSSFSLSFTLFLSHSLSLSLSLFVLFMTNIMCACKYAYVYVLAVRTCWWWRAIVVSFGHRHREHYYKVEQSSI